MQVFRTLLFAKVFPFDPADSVRQRQKGISIVEVMGVVIILAIVALFAFMVMNHQVEKSRLKTDATNTRMIAEAVYRYLIENSDEKGPALGAFGYVDEDNDLVKKGYLAQAPKNPWTGNHRKLDDSVNFYIIQPVEQYRKVKVISMAEQLKKPDGETNSVTLNNVVPLSW